MESAYEQAVWSIPEYRDSIVEQRAREEAEKRLEAQRKEAEASAKASTSVKKKTGSAKKAPKPTTIGDSLKENYEKHIRGEL
jgi:hypothetical protein